MWQASPSNVNVRLPHDNMFSLKLRPPFQTSHGQTKCTKVYKPMQVIWISFLIFKQNSRSSSLFLNFPQPAPQERFKLSFDIKQVPSIQPHNAWEVWLVRPAVNCRFSNEDLKLSSNFKHLSPIDQNIFFFYQIHLTPTHHKILKSFPYKFIHTQISLFHKNL